MEANETGSAAPPTDEEVERVVAAGPPVQYVREGKRFEFRVRVAPHRPIEGFVRGYARKHGELAIGQDGSAHSVVGPFPLVLGMAAFL